MTTAPEPNDPRPRSSLVEALAAGAETTTVGPSELGVVPLDPTLATAGGHDLLAIDGSPDGPADALAVPVARTCGELAALGLGLRTVVLVREAPGRSDGRLPPQPVAIVDGWRAIARHGARTDLRGADLRGADLKGAVLDGADLEDADLSRVNLESASLKGARLTGARLCGATLQRANLQGSDLTGADLRRADLRHSDLRKTALARCAMRGADLFAAYVWDVDFSEAFTSGVDLDRADHRGSAS